MLSKARGIPFATKTLQINFHYSLKRRLFSSDSTTFSPSSSINQAVISPSLEKPVLPEPEIQIQGPSEDPTWHKSTIWFENVYPFKGGIDPRKYMMERYAAKFVENESYKRFIPPSFPDGGELKVRNVESNLKEGGLYLEFKYRGGSIEEALLSIKKHLVENNVRSYFNFQRINAFEVKGRPWVEDLVSRVPSSRLHVEFIKGPDLTIESLYKEFRAFGRIVDIKLQKSTEKEVPRFASVQFLRKRAATSARNCIHGETFEQTTLAIGYEENQGWWYKAWHWVTANIRISSFLILGGIAGISFLVFDPLRRFSITNQITGRYSLSKYTNSATKMINMLKETIKNLFLDSTASIPGNDAHEVGHHWTERKEQIQNLLASFKQTPESIVLVSGPKGSGKSAFINSSLGSQKFKLVIQCDELVGKGDYQALINLSNQVNFFPTFGFLSQLSGFLDTLITATTGAKANLATTNDAECRKVLDCTTVALRNLTENQQKKRSQYLKNMGPRADENDGDQIPQVAYPVIVIEDFLGKENLREQYIYDLLAQWACHLIESRIAHVIFISDRPNVQQVISKYAPSKSIELFHLSDATPAASRSYIKNRLGPNFFIDLAFEGYLTSLGGRLHDLDNFVSKISAGLTPSAAFADMIHRAVAEVRKIGFPEDPAKSGWTDIQFFKVAQLLANRPEIQIDDLAVHSLFGNDPKPIQNMERAGLISIVHQNERPYLIRPSRPIFSLAFKEMVKDTKLTAYMGILTCKKLIADCTKKILDYESELASLQRESSGGKNSEWWFFSDPIQSRVSFLIKQIGIYSRKVEDLDDKSEVHKKQLKLGD